MDDHEREVGCRANPPHCPDILDEVTHQAEPQGAADDQPQQDTTCDATCDRRPRPCSFTIASSPILPGTQMTPAFFVTFSHT